MKRTFILCGTAVVGLGVLWAISLARGNAQDAKPTTNAPPQAWNMKDKIIKTEEDRKRRAGFPFLL